MKNSIIISNLHKNVSEQLIYELIYQVSIPLSVRLRSDQCLVSFTTESEANYVFNVLNNIKLYDKYITIYKPRTNDELVLIIQNIFDYIHEIDVYKVCGNNSLVRVSRENGKSKCICFIMCYEKEESDRILKLNFSHLGNNVLIDYANKK